MKTCSTCTYWNDYSWLCKNPAAGNANGTTLLEEYRDVDLDNNILIAEDCPVKMYPGPKFGCIHHATKAT